MANKDHETKGDWADEVVDRIDGVIGIARDKAVVPLTTAARAAVYGLLAGVLGVVVLVLFAVMLVRILDVAIPGDVWSAHAVVGGLFTLFGLFLWSKRHPKQA